MVLRLTLSLCFTGVASSVNKESNSSEESSIITHCLTWRRGECVSCLSAACQNSPLCVCVCVCAGKAAELHKGLFIRVGQGEEISFRNKNRRSKREMETTGLHIWSYYKASSCLPRKRRHSCPFLQRPRSLSSHPGSLLHAQIHHSYS